MMIIGLFTYRIILRALGVTDYGVYSAVGGIVTMSLLVMNTVASAISRYITVGLGKGDPERLRTIFGTSLAVMGGFCLLIILLTETAGLWYLCHKMVIPPERMGSRNWPMVPAARAQNTATINPSAITRTAVFSLLAKVRLWSRRSSLNTNKRCYMFSSGKTAPSSISQIMVLANISNHHISSLMLSPKDFC